jgi:hypothetical protein
LPSSKLLFLINQFNADDDILQPLEIAVDPLYPDVLLVGAPIQFVEIMDGEFIYDG